MAGRHQPVRHLPDRPRGPGEPRVERLGHQGDPCRPAHASSVPPPAHGTAIACWTVGERWASVSAGGRCGGSVGGWAVRDVGLCVGNQPSLTAPRPDQPSLTAAPPATDPEPESHSVWLGSAPPPRVRGMTPQDPVEGGLAEPDALEPEQGTLALVLPTGLPRPAPTGSRPRPGCCARPAAPRDDAGRGRVDRLTRTTSTGSASRPLGTPGPDRRDLRPAAAPRRAGATCRVELRGSTATSARLNAEALADLAGGATSLWLQRRPDTDARRRPRRGPARPRRGSSSDATSDPVGLRARSFLAHLRRHQPGSRPNLGAPAGRVRATTWWPSRPAGPRRRRRRVVVDAVRRPRPGRVRRPGARLVARRRPRASCASSRRAGIDVDERRRPGRVPLRRDRRAVPDHRQAARGPAALGAGAWRSAAARAAPTSGSTPSPAGR